MQSVKLGTIVATSWRGRLSVLKLPLKALLCARELICITLPYNEGGTKKIEIPANTMDECVNLLWFAVRHALTGSTRYATNWDNVLLDSGPIVSRKYRRKPED